MIWLWKESHRRPWTYRDDRAYQYQIISNESKTIFPPPPIKSQTHIHVHEWYSYITYTPIRTTQTNRVFFARIPIRYCTSKAVTLEVDGYPLRLCFSLSLSLSIDRSIYPSICACLYIHLSIHISVPVCLPACLSVSSLSLPPSISIYVYMCVYA